MRISSIVISVLIGLAVFGLAVGMITNPAGFFQRLAVIALVGAVIFFIVRRLYGANPKKRDQRAFVRAAKRSKKRFQQSTVKDNLRKGSASSITSLRKMRKKSSVHLTVIEGKKGKKKDRASL